MLSYSHGRTLVRYRGGEVTGNDRASLLLFFLPGGVPHISHSNLIEPSLTRAIAGPDVRSSGVSLRLVSGKLTEVPASMHSWSTANARI